MNESKLKEKQRIKAAMNRPREEYYEGLKKQQKAEKMAALTRKKNREDKKNARRSDNWILLLIHIYFLWNTSIGSQWILKKILCWGL